MAQPPPNPPRVTAGLVDTVDDTIAPKVTGRAPTAARPLVRAHVVGGVVVLEVAGRLSDVVEGLDLAIQLALADGPHGVVCDLSAVLEGAEPKAVALLAAAGRHVRDWAAIPVAVVCQDPQVRRALSAHPLGRHLIVTAAAPSALSAVLATPTHAVEWLRLAPHPTAPRASRDFVTRTLLDWRLGGVVPSASLAVSELVTNSATYAGTDIVLSVAWNLGALRLAVRDNSSRLPRQSHSALDLHGRGLTIVAGLSRAFGVLPTTDGGKVVWAVLDALQPRSSPSPSHISPATKESAMFPDPGSVPRQARSPLPAVPVEGDHTFAQHEASSQAALTGEPGPTRLLTLAHVVTAQHPYPHFYSDPSNYLG